MLQFLAVSIFVLGLLGASGCSDEEATARKSLGGVEGGKALADLDDDQLERVCDAANDKVGSAFDDEANQRGACLQAGHVAGRAAAGADAGLDEKEICEITYEGCLDQSLNGSMECQNVASTCEATVADFDRCLTLASAVWERLGDLDCDAVSGGDEDVDVDEIDDQIQASVEACDVKLAGCFVAEQPDASVEDGGGVEPDGSVEPDDDGGL